MDEASLVVATRGPRLREGAAVAEAKADGARRGRRRRGSGGSAGGAPSSAEGGGGGESAEGKLSSEDGAAAGAEGGGLVKRITRKWKGATREVTAQDYRRAVHQFLDDPSSSQAAAICTFVMVSLIVLSVIVLILKETPPYNRNRPLNKAMNQMEVVFNIIFTTEIMLRLSIAETIWQAADLYIVFDILSVMPYWVGLCFKYKLVVNKRGLRFDRGSGNTKMVKKVKEMFKALRMLRLLKLTRRYDGSIVIVHALRDSSSALAAPFFFLFVAVVMCGTFLFVIEDGKPTERDAEKKSQHFGSVVHTIWFMVVTFLTVGFGDVYPMTVEGKIMTGMAMFIGIFDMAMIYAIVGNNFCRVWDEKDKVIFVEKLKEHFQAFSIKRADIEDSFRALDMDGSGSLDYDEFQTALVKMEIKLSSHRMFALWNAIDYDQKGEIRLEEFVNLVFKDQGGAERLLLDDIEDEEEGESPEPEPEPEKPRGTLSTLNSIGRTILYATGRASLQRNAAVTPEGEKKDGDDAPPGGAQFPASAADAARIEREDTKSDLDHESSDFRRPGYGAPDGSTDVVDLRRRPRPHPNLSALANQIASELKVVARDQAALSRAHDVLSLKMHTLVSSPAPSGGGAPPALKAGPISPRSLSPRRSVVDRECVAAKRALNVVADELLAHCATLERDDLAAQIRRIVSALGRPAGADPSQGNSDLASVSTS